MSDTKSAGWQAERINAAFDESKVLFKGDDRAAVLAALRNNGEREVTFGDDGLPYIRYDNVIQPLADVLFAFAHDRRDLADGRSLPKQDEGRGRPGILSKESFKTTREKVDWIAANGETAYAALPLKEPTSTELRYKEDYYGLSRPQKVLLTAKNPNILAELPNRPKDVMAGVRERIEQSKSRFQRDLNDAQAAELAATRS